MNFWNQAGNLAYQGYQKAGKIANQTYHVGGYLLNQTYNGSGNVFNNMAQGVMNIYNNNLDYDKMNPNDYFENKIPEIEKSFRDFNTNKYIDPYFKEISSIINNEKNLIDINQFYFIKKSFEDEIQSNNLEWRRISDMISKEQDEYNKNIPLIESPNKGNCYLISFLRGMLRFQTKNYHELFRRCIFDKGYFEVKLYVDFGETKNGKKIATKKKVFVDDFILYDKKEGAPYFSRLDNYNKYIVSSYLLLEKAMAKFFGCYHNLFESKESEPNKIIFTLTGIQPTPINFNYYDQRINDLFQIIKNEINKKNVMICISGSLSKNIGIDTNHAYTIIGIEEEDNIFIINLENPFGHNSMKLLNYEIKGNVGNKIKNYNRDNINNGCLKICLEDLSKYFINILICDFFSSSSWFW